MLVQQSNCESSLDVIRRLKAIEEEVLAKEKPGRLGNVKSN
jgi:hypothetical protein